MNYIDKLIYKLQKSPLNIIQFNRILQNSNTFYDDINLEKELIISNGLPLYISDDEVILKTKNTKIKEQVFCIVDIETTAGKVKDGQVIEIAAIKFKNNRIIEVYQSLVTAHFIPKIIQKITGIREDMLVDAPNLKDVLEEFKLFLEDDVFLAHNIDFDYKFISDSFKKYNLGELFNRKLCTIDLAEKTIQAQKYGLKHLTEDLNIPVSTHHRAFDDAMSTMYVFQEILKNLPLDIKYTEELISFSKKGMINE
jgi:DNA polymerase-3 subunit epsilon